MKLKFPLKYITILVILSIIFSCKKGDPGPPGPAGTSSSSVSSIKSYTFTLDTFIYFGSGRYFNNITMPVITADILSKGMVNAYWQYNGSDVALPQTLYLAGHSTSISYNASLSQCRIEITRSDFLQAPVEIPKPYKFKVVVTSGN